MTLHTITLTQFEAIDGAMSSILRMGPFETCADPRSYIRAENRLFDLCVEAAGFPFTNDFASSLECAATIVTRALTGQIEVLDAEAA